MTPEALAYWQKQTKRIATLEQQNAELLRDMNTAYQQIKTEQRLSFRDQVAGLEAEVAALTKERNALQDKLNAVVTVGIREREQLVAAQAREAKLRDAAKAVLEVGMGSDFEALNAALALPTDDSALMERLKEEYKRGYKAGITTGSMT